MNFDASVISYSDQDMDGDGISNNLDVHMPGDDDGDGVPSPNDPYPNNDEVIYSEAKIKANDAGKLKNKLNSKALFCISEIFNLSSV